MAQSWEGRCLKGRCLAKCRAHLCPKVRMNTQVRRRKGTRVTTQQRGRDNVCMSPDQVISCLRQQVRSKAKYMRVIYIDE